MSTMWTWTPQGIRQGIQQEIRQHHALAPPSGLRADRPIGSRFEAARAGVEAPGPPLHAALAYCARRLSPRSTPAATQRPGRHASGGAADPGQRRLLRWWFSSDTAKRGPTNSTSRSGNRSCTRSSRTSCCPRTTRPSSTERLRPQPVADTPYADATPTACVWRPRRRRWVVHPCWCGGRRMPSRVQMMGPRSRTRRCC